MLVHALLDTGGHSHDVPHQGVPVPKPASSAVSGVSPADGQMLAKEKAAGNGNSSSMEAAMDATQPPSPAETNPDNLKSLISSRQGRSLFDVRGLEPVCWNVIAGDLVRWLVGLSGALFRGCSFLSFVRDVAIILDWEKWWCI